MMGRGAADAARRATVKKIFIICHSMAIFQFGRTRVPATAAPSSKLDRRPMLAQWYCKTKREALRRLLSSSAI
jgi:hypothetical protein